MDMKKIACAVVIATASLTNALANDDADPPALGPTTAASATATSGAMLVGPMSGSLVVVSVLSFMSIHLLCFRRN